MYGKYGWIKPVENGFYATFTDRDALESVASPPGRPSRPGERATLFFQDKYRPLIEKALQIPKSPERQEAWKKHYLEKTADLESLGICSTESLRKRGTILWV